MRHLLFATLLLSSSLLSMAQPPQVAYEIFIRSFADSDGDGIGDLKGITLKLDYLKELGIDMIWITPVGPSPSYHKYDVVDYRGIDPEYGTLADYQNLVEEAHERDIKVLLDFVINHTSELHPWFKEAVKGPNNPYRDFYVWLPPQTIDSLGIAIRKQTPDSWEANPWHFHKEGDAEKYYGLFSPVMPDLNFDNPVVRDSVYAIGKWWLEKVGVDGFRMDAAKHIYPSWESHKAIAFWKEFREEMESINPDVFIVGEVYADAEVVTSFYKGLNSNFHIQLSTLIPAIVQQGRDSNLVPFLVQTYDGFSKSNPDFIDATLLRNHDQPRVGSDLGGDINKMKVAANLLLTLPGLPFLYYGEEIGMLGTKPDEEIREPFLWAPAAKDSLRTHWRAPVHSTEERVSPLSTQMEDENSLFSHYQQLIYLRKTQPALRQQEKRNIMPVQQHNPSLIAFVRPHETGDLLIIHNLSGEPQPFQSWGNDYEGIWLPREATIDKEKDVWTLLPYSMLILRKAKP